MGLFKVISTGFKSIEVITEVAAATTIDIAKSTTCTLGDTIKATSHDGICTFLGKRIMGIFFGTVKRTEAAEELVEETEKCPSDKNYPFLIQENAKKLTTVATVGLVSLAGASFDDKEDSSSSEPVESDSGLLPSNADIFALHNGISGGDQNDLDSFARADHIEGTEHLEAEDVDRNLVARHAFLHELGYSSV